MLTNCYNLQLIKNVDNWEQELNTNNNLIKSNYYPYWYGYKNINSQ